jgi:anti-sigma regulatory factor (Ser/Thr protein kinase)
MNTGNEFDSKSNTATSVHALVEKSKKGGLGLMLIHKIVDQVEFLHKDNMNICKILMSVKK